MADNHKLDKLKEAFDAGILTEEEYNNKVAEVTQNEIDSSMPEEYLNNEERETLGDEDDGVVYLNSSVEANSVEYDTSVNSKSRKKGVKLNKKLLIVIGVVIAILVIALVACHDTEETYEWPTSGMATMLPEPEGRITTLWDDEDSLEADVKIADESYYDEYVEECKKLGFDLTDDAGYQMYDEKAYTAFNKDGYKLDLGYSDYDEPEMEIYLYRPIKSGEIGWPVSGIGKTLPKPASMKGELVSESEDSFEVYVANTTAKDYDEYIKSVMDAGYNKDYDKDDYKFTASYKDSEDVNVTITYYGNKFMNIYVSDWRDDSEDSADIEDDSDTDTDTSEMSSDFKETMDNYEAWFDHYCDVMKKAKDNPSDLELLSEMTDLLAEESEMLDEMDSMDQSEMNSAELAYYLEVTARIEKKLLEVAY